MRDFSRAFTTALVLVVVASALLAVHSKHRQRLLFAEYQQLRARADAAEVQWGRLLLEEATLGNLNRLERIAMDKMDMGVPAPRQVVRVQP